MIEDVHHWLLSCPVWSNLRQPIIARARKLNSDFDNLSTDVKVPVILQRSQDCQTLMCNVVCPIQLI